MANRTDVVVLVDAKWLLYRSHFANLNLRTKDGRPSGGIHGFLMAVCQLYRKLPEARVVFCWDAPGEKWRHQLYAEYKKTRQVTDETKKVNAQVGSLVTFLRIMGFRQLLVKGMEADDLIGLMVQRLLGERHVQQVRIFSGDKDLYQLTSPAVTLWKDVKKAPMTYRAVWKEIGLPPECWPQLKALMGDKTDNIPGIGKGIGPKKALELWRNGMVVRDQNGRISLGHTWNQTERRKPWWPDLNNDQIRQRVFRAYQLSKVPRCVEEIPVSSYRQAVLSCETKWVAIHPGRKQKWSGQMEKELLRFCSDWELESVIERRKEFWRMN